MDRALLSIGLFAILEQGFRLFVSLLKVLCRETAPFIFGQLERIVRHPIQVESRDRHFLLRSQVGNECHAGCWLLERQRGVEDFLQQLSAFTQYVVWQLRL